MDLNIHLNFDAKLTKYEISANNDIYFISKKCGGKKNFANSLHGSAKIANIA